MSTIRVWDLPTRAFHWTLVVSVLALFITGNVGGNWLIWHMRIGCAVGSLLLFRLVWGFVGGHWSRFATFFPTKARLLGYLRKTNGAFDVVGHNPLGALSVFAMLVALLFQVSTGLVANDEIAFTGPLNQFVTEQVGGLATWYHAGLGKVIVLGLVVLHVLAIAFYRLVKRKHLVKAMLSGDQVVADTTVPRAAKDTAATRLLALLVVTACGVFMWWVATLDKL